MILDVYLNNGEKGSVV